MAKDSVGGWFRGRGPRAVYSVPASPKQEQSPHSGHNGELTLAHIGLCQMPLVTSPVCGVHGQELEVYSGRGGCPVREPRSCISALWG